MSASRLTFVTCLYDLSKRGTQNRSVDWLFANSEFVLDLDHEVVIFTEPELEQEILKRRAGRPTRIQLIPFEALLAPARAEGAYRGHRQSNTTASKVTPAYVQLMWAKYAMLESALTLTRPTHVAWIDVAITHVAKVRPGIADVFRHPADLPKFHMLRYFDETETIIPRYWYTLHGHLAGGLVIGEVGRMRDLITAFWGAVDMAIENALAPVDEAILSYLAAQQPDRYAFSYGDYCDIVRNHDRVRGGLGHLLWQARDARDRGKINHVETLKAAVVHAIQAQTIEEVDPPAIKALFTEFPEAQTVTDRSAHDVRDEKPLLGLVMIVKNEAHGIAKTLLSFKPVINAWTILDTGSTDGTQELIRSVLGDIPGQLYEEPFVDFSTSRNRALELHGEATSFTVMPDSDDVLEHANALGSFLANHVYGEEPAFRLNLQRPPLDYWLPLVLRSSARWRYTGRVHECCGPQAGPGFASVSISSVTLRQDRPAQSGEATRKRWERDLKLLTVDFLADPDNKRTMFYLAQTHECLGNLAKALALYEQHVELEGWIEERIEAALRRAKILNALGRSWSEVQQAFLDVYRMDPRRAEPLFYIAEHWYAEQVHPLAFLFASRAAKLEPVSTALFLDRDIYDYRAANVAAISAFYCDQLGDPEIKTEGRRFAEQAVRARPHDEQYRANWSFYAPSVAEALGARIQPIDFTPEAPYTASNPSVHFDGKRWRALVRTTNYKIVDGQYLTPDDNVIYTRNWMVELTHATFKTKRAIEMKDLTDLPTSSYPVHGYEDCRLFRHQGTLYASATVCDWTPDGKRELTIARLDADYQIVDAWPVRGAWSAVAQKNWMPVEGHDLRFIYATRGPTTILTADPAARKITEPAELGHGRLRGGSQVVKVGKRWLGLVHDVSWPGGSARTYLHRFVQFDSELRVVAMTDPFYFERRGIEFCCGLGFDGEKLVASFSVEDRCAKLAIFDPARVQDALRTDYTV